MRVVRELRQSKRNIDDMKPDVVEKYKQNRTEK